MKIIVHEKAKVYSPMFTYLQTYRTSLLSKPPIDWSMLSIVRTMSLQQRGLQLRGSRFNTSMDLEPIKEWSRKNQKQNPFREERYPGYQPDFITNHKKWHK